MRANKTQLGPVWKIPEKDIKFRINIPNRNMFARGRVNILNRSLKPLMRYIDPKVKFNKKDGTGYVTIERKGDILAIGGFYPTRYMNSPQNPDNPRPLLENRGIGKYIMKKIIEQAKKKNIRGIMIMPTKLSENFYKSMGFYESAVGYFFLPLNLKSAREFASSSAARLPPKLKKKYLTKIEKSKTKEEIDEIVKNIDEVEYAIKHSGY